MIDLMNFAVAFVLGLIAGAKIVSWRYERIIDDALAQIGRHRALEQDRNGQGGPVSQG